MWKDLILRYCKHHKLFVLSTEETDDLELFHNTAINRESAGLLARGLYAPSCRGAVGPNCPAPSELARG